MHVEPEIVFLFEAGCLGGRFSDGFAITLTRVIKNGVVIFFNATLNRLKFGLAVLKDTHGPINVFLTD